MFKGDSDVLRCILEISLPSPTYFKGKRLSMIYIMHIDMFPPPTATTTVIYSFAKSSAIGYLFTTAFLNN